MKIRYQKKINLILLLFLSTCFTACKKEDAFATCRQLIIDRHLFQSDSGDDFLFEDIRVVGHCIEMTVRYGGGCGSINADLVGSSVVERSDIPKRGLRLLFEDDDPCKAFMSATFSFSLRGLQVPGSKIVYLEISGWPDPIVYTY